jgi:hypothetical protein
MNDHREADIIAARAREEERVANGGDLWDCYKTPHTQSYFSRRSRRGRASKSEGLRVAPNGGRYHLGTVGEIISEWTGGVVPESGATCSGPTVYRSFGSALLIISPITPSRFPCRIG